jgi:L-alanine-DL-glutamate epimerase-like enolase superfamily enzyme
LISHIGTRLVQKNGRMKITNIETYVLRTPRPETGKVTADSFLPYWTHLTKAGIRSYYVTCFVKVITGEGLEGIGECTVREAPEAHAEIIERLLKPIIVGSDPSDHQVLWDRMFASLRTRGHSEGFFLEAISGVDLALWDLTGKKLGLPVHKLLGGAHEDKVKAYASSIFFGKPEDVADEARRLVEKGHDQMKLKIGMSSTGPGRGADVANVKAIRDAIGYDIDLMVDANSAFSASSAIRIGRKLEHYEVYWFEEPVPPDDLDGYIRVSHALDIPVSGSESLFGRYNFRDLIVKQAVDIVQPDIGRCGGISECQKIAAMAEAYDLPFTPHVGFSGGGVRAATLQFVSTLPREIFLTYEYMYRPSVIGNEVLKEPLERFHKGYLELPTKPGLGIELNEQALADHRAS